jgi:hypothetical protein
MREVRIAGLNAIAQSRGRRKGHRAPVAVAVGLPFGLRGDGRQRRVVLGRNSLGRALVGNVECGTGSTARDGEREEREDRRAHHAIENGRS